jgi:translation initiation factor eIF-2B subunit alpha
MKHEEEIQIKVDLFSKLFRELEAEIGTRDLARLVIAALDSSVKNLRIKNVGDFCKQFDCLVEILSNTEPKFGVLNFHFASMQQHFKESLCHADCSEKKWKRYASREIVKIEKNAKRHKKELLNNAGKLDVEGKTILIHDHSHTVQDVLSHYKKMGKNFKVIIAEQNFEKTYSNIERMFEEDIPFRVVPSYMLSHMHSEIDMLFFGGLTLKDTMNFVMDPGTHSVISEFNLEHTPIYMFIDTSKFSLWKSKKRGEIFIHSHKRKHHSKDIEFNRVKYSHDRVPLSLFKKVITNEGVFSNGELKKLFEKRLNKHV